MAKQNFTMRREVVSHVKLFMKNNILNVWTFKTISTNVFLFDMNKSNWMTKLYDLEKRLHKLFDQGHLLLCCFY